MATVLVRTGYWVLVRCHRTWILCSPTTVSASGKITSNLSPHGPKVVTADPRALTYSGDAADYSLMLEFSCTILLLFITQCFYFKSSPCCAQNNTTVLISTVLKLANMVGLCCVQHSTRLWHRALRVATNHSGD